MADAGPDPLAPPSRAPRRALRWIGASLLVLALLVVAAKLALPGIVQSQIQKLGGEALGRELRVDAVEIALTQLAITLRGVHIAGAGGQGPEQLSIDELHADLDARSLLRLTPVIEALRIERPRARLTRLVGGGWDIDDILARLAARPAAPPDAEPTRFALYNLQLRGGEFAFDDQPVKARHALTDIQLELPFISNLDVDVQVHVQPQLSLRSQAATLNLKGKTLPFAPDRASELTIRLAPFDLARVWPYLPADLAWRPSGGVLTSDITLRFAQPPKQPARVQLAGTLSVEQLALAHRSAAAGEPTLAWKRLDVQMLDVAPLARRVGLGTVKLDGAAFDVRRDADGELAIARAQPGAKKAEAPAPAASAASAADPGWTVSVQRTELANAQLGWRDATTKPAADLRLAALNASAGPLQWPLQQAVPFEAGAELRAAPDRIGQITLKGDAAADKAHAEVTLAGLKLAAFQPYLTPLLVPRISGEASLQGRVAWNGGSAVNVQLANAGIERLRVQEPTSKQAAIDIAALRLAALELDLVNRTVKLGSLRIERPRIALQRAPDGQLNVQRWLVPAPAGAAPAAEAKPAPAWQVDARELNLTGGLVSWTDEATPGADGRAHQLQAADLRITLGALRWPSGAGVPPARLQLATRLGAGTAEAGRIEWNGSLAPTPLALAGTLRAERVSALAFGPYLTLPLRLASAELGWRGELKVAQEAAGWRVDARGAALVADLDLHAKRVGAPTPDTQLLAWQSLRAEPLQVAMVPGQKPRIEIGELALADFFARLVVTEQGRFNLADLQGEPVAATAPAAATAAPAAAVAAPPAAAAPPAVATSAAPRADLPADITIGGINLTRGRVDFSDRFIRPNYSAALSELQGRVGRFSSASREMAPVELSGRVAGTGLLDIRGSANPTANPLALDLRARATDLELAPLSPYSGKYAGYAIERGKLSVNLAYRIDPDGKLEASNQIVLNQLTFGAKVDSPDATKLPVRFALSLLADRNGVIDINLPVSGSINDPQFSVFGLVLRLVGNLIVKAVTSPFSLLFGGGGGAGDDASLVAFEPGSTRPTAEGRAAIERVAKALAERPALRLTVGGHADAAETEARRDELMRRALREEQRREQQRSLAPGAAAPAASAPSTANAENELTLPTAGSAAHTALLSRLYARTPLPDKPRNLLGLLRDPPAPEMAARLRAALPLAAPGADPWRELALERSLVVRDALIARGLANERLFLGAPNAVPAEGAAGAASAAPAPASGAAATPATPGPAVRLGLSGS